MTQLDSVRDANIVLLSRYALAVHKHDWKSLGDLFTPDATFAAKRTFGFGGPEEGAFVIETREKIVELTAQITEGLSETHILISNHVVDAAVDNNSAEVSCYFRVYHAGRGERAHLFEESLGRFEVKTVRVGSGWQIRRLDETVMVMLGTADAFGPIPDIAAGH